jgi:hypothetical protein
LRRRIRRGLLKVEQLHTLARDVFYGRLGRINAHELREQSQIIAVLCLVLTARGLSCCGTKANTCSCLNLILACIFYWRASEISRAISQCDPGRQ